MYGRDLSVKRTSNGFTVTVRDPDIEKANRAPRAEYRDPDIEYVFETADAAATFVTKALEGLGKATEYETAFAKALREEAKNVG